jgi:two-component system response regulator RegA
MRDMDSIENLNLGHDPSLLILDDDEPFTRTLGRAMERRGFDVKTILNVKEGLTYVKETPPAYAIVDLRLGDGNGLDVVEKIRETRPDSSIVVLTGYGAIATAVAAVKIGAVDYLAKPADANDITAALLSKSETKPPPPENPMSADRVRWEHIQRVFELCDRNVSETARRLSMHRRTLQRILAKRSPR